MFFLSISLRVVLLLERAADITVESARQVLTEVLVLQWWNEHRGQEPASPGPQVTIQETEAKEGLHEHKASNFITDKHLIQLNTCNR